MGTKQFSNYEDLITFSRASGGHALRPVSYGDELVTNGDFATDSDWTKGTGWSISGGEAVGSSASSNLQQPIPVTLGKIYLVSFEITSNTAGSIDRVQIQTQAGPTLNASSTGVYTSVITAPVTGSQQLYLVGSGFSGSIDNVSVKEVLFDQPDGTLTLFEHPNNIPRVEYDADGNRLGLLVEEARTNLVTSSDATGWTVAAASATDNTETTLGAFVGAVVSSNGADWHRYRPANITVTSGTTYAVTLFYEYGTSGDVLLNFRDVSGANESRITGAWGSLTIPYQNAGTLTILEETALPQNVKKVVAKFVPNFSGNFEIGIGPHSNTSGETVIAYAAQCEQASFGTSYIKTTGSTATRSADVASIPVADFGYNQSAGSIVIDAIANGDDARFFSIDDTTFNDRIHVRTNTDGGGIRTFVNTNNTSQTNSVSGAYDYGDSVKVSLAFKTNDLATYADGEQLITDTTIEIPQVTQVQVGKGIYTPPINGHIKSIKYYPRRLTNAQLQELTS